MLHELLSANRSRLVERARAKVTARPPHPSEEALENGAHLLLDQLIVILRRAQVAPDLTDLRLSGGLQGRRLAELGFTVAEVVRDYASLCQAVTDLADEGDVAIRAAEFHTFTFCLDEAAAAAVSEHARVLEQRRADEERERLGALAHELRNRLSAAMLAFSAIKSGRAPFAGSTGHMLWRNLRGIRDLVDHSLAQVRLESSAAPLAERIFLAGLIEDVEVEASLDAEERQMSLLVAPVPPDVCVLVDPGLLTAAVINLLQNAFKFNTAAGRVSLTTSTTTDRVLVEVEDECGGLPEGVTETLFEPYVQMGKDRRGLGLGLVISRSAVEAFGGQLRVRDLPGRGCIFTIDLPRCS